MPQDCENPTYLAAAGYAVPKSVLNATRVIKWSPVGCGGFPVRASLAFHKTRLFHGLFRLWRNRFSRNRNILKISEKSVKKVL